MTNSREVSEFRKYDFGIADAAAAEFLPEGSVAEPLVPKGMLSSAHLMPKLVNLRQLSDVSWATLLGSLHHEFRDLQHPAIALFIKTGIPEDEFKRHWNSIQIVRAHPNRKSWLRIHDPRVLHQLLRVLNLRQRHRLFGRTQEFHYWAGTQWVTATHSPRIQAECGNSITGSSQWDWPRIERIGIVNRALHGARIADPVELTSKGATAEELIERAIVRHGLSEQDDLVEFVIRGLSIHLRFDEHPQIARTIRPPDDSHESSSLSDRFALVEEKVWDVLRHSTYPPMGT